MSVVFIRLAFAFVAATLGTTSFGTRNFYAPLLARSEQQANVTQDRPEVSQSTDSLELPINFERQLGDLDGMVKRHQIRVLVVPSRSGFFYDLGQPHGIFYEAFNEFQRFANQKLKTGTLKVNIEFIPFRPEQLEHALVGRDRRRHRLPGDRNAGA